MLILCTYNYGEEEFSLWRQMGFEVRYIQENALDVNTALEDVDVLICYAPFKQIVVDRLTNLKFVLLSSIGFDQLPESILKNTSVIVTNNQGGYSPPIGEWIVMMLLMGFKKAPRLIEYNQQHKWRTETDLLELTYKKVFFLGTGTLATEAAKRLQGFECELIGVNTKGKETKHFHRCITWKNWSSQIDQADAVVCCLPLTPHTTGILDNDFFSALSPEAIFINISRGSVIDEDALEKHLEMDKFRFVALDVFKEEPLSPKSLLWEFPQVLVTSHQSWVSEMRNQRRLETIRYNLEGIARGTQLRHIIDKERGY